MIAALYVDPKGPYIGRPDVDAWTKDRDARQYWGPHPVVAHPDCGPWSKLRHMCTKQDRSCAPLAIAQVRQFGGVLEHPAHSKLWDLLSLPSPNEVLADEWGGRSYHVDQCDWGHRCRKPTWLYVVQKPDVQAALGDALSFAAGRGTPTHKVDGGPRDKCYSPLPGASKVARRITPHGFAELLIATARGTGTPTHCVCTGPRQKERLPVATKLVKRITPPAFAELLIEIARRCQ